MLGSLQDAEDALQETLLAAWLGLDGFEGRSSVRTWLYRIATNRCLNLLRVVRAGGRSTAAPLPVPPPEPTRLGEVLVAAALPGRAARRAARPGARARGPVRVPRGDLARVRHRRPAAAAEPARRAAAARRARLPRAARPPTLLGLTEDAVTSALKRARATLDARPLARPAAARARRRRRSERCSTASSRPSPTATSTRSSR